MLFGSIFAYIQFLGRYLMKQTIRPGLILFLFTISAGLLAQPANYPYKVDQSRMLWHDNVDREQKRLLALDGKADDSITMSKDENVNLQIADALIRQVDEMQKQIELDSVMSG